MRIRGVWFVTLVAALAHGPLLHAAENPDPILLPLYEVSREGLVEAAKNYLATVGHEDWGYAVGGMPPLSRVFREGGPKVRWWDEGPFTLSLARGEMEHLQWLIVPAEGGLEAVRVTVAPFTHVEESHTLDVSVGPVGFVRTDRRPPARTEVEMGDVMLPSAPFDIPAAGLGAAYLLAKTSPETPAGRYVGQIRVTPEGRTTIRANVEIEVWDIELPRTPPLHGWISSSAVDVLLDHKLEPGWFSPGFDLADPVTDQEWQACRDRIQAWFAANHSFLMIITPGGRGHGHCVGGAGDGPMPEFSAEQIEAMIAYWRRMAGILEDLGRLEQAAVYVWDEPGGGRFAEVARICDWVHEAHPRLKTCAAGWWPMRSLRDQGALDIYCPVSFSYEGGLDRSGHPSGTEAWWYVCWIPPAPAPNLMVGNPPLQQRIIGWQSWRFGVTGFLYWSAHRAHWDQRTSYEPPSANCGSAKNGGDGTLLYTIQGKHVPSLRLRHLADGMEDLQLLRILEERLARCDQAGLDPMDPQWREAREAARLALGQASALVYADYSITHRLVQAYDKDPARMLAARRSIVNAALRLKSLLDP